MEIEHVLHLTEDEMTLLSSAGKLIKQINEKLTESPDPMIVVLDEDAEGILYALKKILGEIEALKNE